MRLRSVETGEALRCFEHPWYQYPYQVALSPDGRHALADDLLVIEPTNFGGLARFVGRLLLIDIEGEQLLRAIGNHDQRVRSFAFSPDARNVLTGGNDSQMVLWNTNDGQHIREFKGHTKAVSCLAFAPNGRSALSGCDDNVVRFWSVETGRRLRRFEGHSKAVRCLAYSPDGLRALSGSEDGSLCLWRVPEE